jgi:energy-coupling factor transport system ATP-binding protein
MLEAINISHTYQPGTPFHRRALGGIDLNLASGECILVTGPSGSGKTTLARILSGLEEPEVGEVRLGETNLYGSEGSSAEPSIRVVLACQYPERQFFSDTVWEELGWGLYKNPDVEVTNVPQHLIDISEDFAFPLVALASRSPRSLSSGQQRKVALMTLLALEPDVLILDEPLAGLNVRERHRLTEVLRGWPSDYRAMLIISHELELFLDWVTKIAVLDAGRLVFLGSPNELCHIAESSVHEAIYLPPLIELGRYLHRQGLGEESVSTNGEIVYQKLKNALSRKLD